MESTINSSQRIRDNAIIRSRTSRGLVEERRRRRQIIQDVIVHMKPTEFDKLEEIRPKDDSICVICVCAIKTPIKKLECEHEFHINCLSDWITKLSTKCPMCRIDIAKNDQRGYIYDF